MLIYSQTGYDQRGRAFELARTVYRADRYLFRGTLVAEGEGRLWCGKHAEPGPPGRGSGGMPSARRR